MIHGQHQNHHRPKSAAGAPSATATPESAPIRAPRARLQAARPQLRPGRRYQEESDGPIELRRVRIAPISCGMPAATPPCPTPRQAEPANPTAGGQKRWHGQRQNSEHPHPTARPAPHAKRRQRRHPTDASRQNRRPHRKDDAIGQQHAAHRKNTTLSSSVPRSKSATVGSNPAPGSAFAPRLRKSPRAHATPPIAPPRRPFAMNWKNCSAAPGWGLFRITPTVFGISSISGLRGRAATGESLPLPTATSSESVSPIKASPAHHLNHHGVPVQQQGPVIPQSLTPGAPAVLPNVGATPESAWRSCPQTEVGQRHLAAPDAVRQFQR